MSEDQKNASGESTGTSEAPKSRAGNNGETNRPDKDSRSSGSRGSSSRNTKSRSSNKGMITGVLSAVVILAAGGGAVAATSMVPEPSGGTTMEIRQADVPAGRSLGVCPEPARLVSGTVVGTDADFSPVSTTATSALNAVVLSNPAGTVPESNVTSLGGETVEEIAKAPTSTPTPTVGPPVLAAGVANISPVASPTVVGAEALGNEQASLAANLSYSATDGDLRGLASTQCQPPGNDAWLLGANTAVGRTAVLNVSNASETPATVSLDLYGSEGQIQAPGARGLLVAPGSTRSVNLAGLAPGESQLAVHVRSTGGPVASTIQQSVLRGIAPGGVEYLSPGAAPSNVQVMSGVDIQDPAAVKALAGKSGFADAVPALRIAVPGSTDAVVQVSLYGANGERKIPNGGVVTVKGGTVTTLNLEGVPAGSYTVRASSDVSFLASARVTRGSKAEEPTDFAWSPSSARLGSQHLVAVPRDGQRSLSFGVPEGRGTVSYAPVTADGKVGKAVDVDMSGGTTSVIGLPDKSGGSAVVGYVVSASGDPVFGALVLGKQGRSDVSVVAIQDAAAGLEKVPVSVGY
ncbi:UNVERIFIED_CONTAM: P pilus assembly chaperone PapD [Jeotgalibacillus campisalis]